MELGGPVQIAAPVVDLSLTAKTPLQAVKVAQPATNTFLLLVEGHCPVQVALLLKDCPLVTKASLDVGKLGQAPADALLFLEKGHRPVEFAACPQD